MNKLKQQIKEFHQQLIPVLKRVLELYPEKTIKSIYLNIIRPCRSLIQKCSFKSVNDTSSLCSLAYWLYIYDHKQLALEICELTHGVDFVIESRHRSVLDLYGLEIRLARELFGERREANIPPRFLEHYFHKRVKKQLAYPQVLREGSKYRDHYGYMEHELAGALYDLIGKGETGIYTELNENWDRIQEIIDEYIALLRQ